MSLIAGCALGCPFFENQLAGLRAHLSSDSSHAKGLINGEEGGEVCKRGLTMTGKGGGDMQICNRGLSMTGKGERYAKGA